MNKKMLGLLVILCGSLLVRPLCAQSTGGNREEVIRHLEEDERKAVLASDTAKLEELWSPMMIVNNPQSTITPDRQAILNLVRGGFIKYSRFERTIEAIRFHGDLAIVMGAETVEPIGNNPKAGQSVKRRFTNVWLQAGGRWQVIAARQRHSGVEPRQSREQNLFRSECGRRRPRSQGNARDIMAVPRQKAVRAQPCAVPALSSPIFSHPHAQRSSPLAR
ncbi:nuclear transport factor 2 family protein [Opitutus terrae]|nr:nuclear transport factor 2 family protein [Opitutus terrae]